MNKVILALVLLGTSGACRAQTFAEWFEQTKTEHKYYLRQIAALQIFIGEAEKGYAILESGLNTIKGIKSGEFNMHNAFYNGLEAINPAIGNMGDLVEIVALQVAIVDRFSRVLVRYRQSVGMWYGEVDYIGKVYSVMLSAGMADINSLLDIITANKLKMTDDQRMERIREVDVAMKDRYAFAANLTNKADLLYVQRQAERTEVGTVKGLYGVP